MRCPAKGEQARALHQLTALRQRSPDLLPDVVQTINFLQQ